MESKKVVRFVFIFVLIVVILFERVLADTYWKIKGEKILFHWETQDFEAQGNVEFLGKDILVRANYIKGNIKEGIFKAEGEVLFKDKNGEFFAEILEYFYKEEKAVIKNVKLSYPAPESKERIYIEGTEVLWAKGNFSLKEGNFTTCSYEKPHYYISSSQLEYYPNDKMTFVNVLFFLKVPFSSFYIPFFYVPYYVLPLTKEPSPFPQFGYDSNLGFYLSYPFTYSLWGVPGILTLSLSQNQGVKFTLSQKYQFPNLSGSFTLSYLYNYIYNTDEFKFILSGYYKPSPALSLNFSTNYLLYPYSHNYSWISSAQLTYTSDVVKASLQTNWN
ncbi:MAG: LPS-assembly protein LptD, partial [Dictyoglomus sp.]